MKVEETEELSDITESSLHLILQVPVSWTPTFGKMGSWALHVASTEENKQALASSDL